MVAVVVDPIRSMSTGKVEIGAFRTYPENYNPTGSASEQDLIPLEKIADWGFSANKYYSLSVSYYKSSLDTKIIDILWNKYWITTLSNNTLVGNKDYNCQKINDLAKKYLKQAGEKKDKLLTLDQLIAKGRSEFRDFFKVFNGKEPKCCPRICEKLFV